MTPAPQERHQENVTGEQEYVPPVLERERIVISGMSGLYPESRNVKEFSDILYDKKNPVVSTSLRWSHKHPEVAEHIGPVPDLDRFDAQFFMVHYRLGNCMDPASRKILEQSYQAIYDAGVNPEHLSGKKIGVYIGNCFSETEKASSYDTKHKTGLGITGCNKAMFANRISYWLNSKGPSMSIDEACCSSAVALEQAYLALSRGDCEAAIVGGAFLCLHPQTSVLYGRIMKQPKDGKTKSFDQNADGCVKSEAINIIFLQKAKDAKRVYAELLHVKTEFIGLLKGETSPLYGFNRNPDAAVNFLKTFYEEARVPPQAVEYVEAFGSGIAEADKTELESIDTVICKGRNEQLLVGSVTSNIGYTEAASNLVGITKVLLGYHTGKLAANLHCSHPREDVEALREGRIRILTEHQPFKRSYAAINGMSITGVNSHVLLHGYYKPKDLSRYQSSIPYLVTMSARQESSVKNIFDYLKSRQVDPEEIALLHNIHKTDIAGHLGRGYMIMKSNENNQTESLCETVQYFDGVKKPLWFVYSGMGSQWPGMGEQLMRIPIFAAAIERCSKVLQPQGIDIVNIITSKDKKIFDNILNSFVGIAAIQIGLTDVLRDLGLVPDGIIGHSVGELGCAYADGCLTAEEMISSAYSRGTVSLETSFIRGSMAAVGLGYKEISKICPPEIEVACHNGPESSTISGPADVMSEFVATLTNKGIFAKEVPCSNIAYHSRYIADAGPALLKILKNVMKTPRPRSKRWVSTSIPEERWNSELAQYSSAEYHTNNLLNPVLFEETMCHIPKNAVLVEVAPHGLLQAILKRSLSAGCKNIALTRRGHPDNAYLLLDAIGQLYAEGFNPKVDVLYPQVEMPVSTGTPFLSHITEWAHGEKWTMPFYRSSLKVKSASCNHIVSLHDKEHSYLQGHVINDKKVFPFAAVLVSVWDTLAMHLGVPQKQLSVKFSDVHLYVQPSLHYRRQFKFNVSMTKGTGSFEVLHDNIKVAAGIITHWKPEPNSNIARNNQGDIDMNLPASDIYSLFGERGYSYSGELCSIECASSCLSKASILWRDNWVTLIDGMLQLNMLRQTYDGVTLPTHIRTLSIDVIAHENHKIVVSKDKVLFNAESLEQYDSTRCGGVLIESIRYRNLPISNNNMALHTLKFVGNVESNQKISTSLQVYLQMVAENVNKDLVNVIGIKNNHTKGNVFDIIKEVESNVYGISICYKEYNQEEIVSMKNSNTVKDADLVVLRNLSNNDNMCQLLHTLLQSNTFIVSEEDQLIGGRDRPAALYRVVSSHSCDNSRLDLLRWRPSQEAVPTTSIIVRSHSDIAHLSSARASLLPNHRLIIIASHPALTGLKRLVQEWRRETERNMVHLLTVNNDEIFLEELPQNDLAFAVFKHDKWGGEYYIKVEDCEKETINVALQSQKLRDFNSLKWIEVPETSGSGIPVKVHYAGLSNTDIKKANGLISLKSGEDDYYGMDFSGTTKSGSRIMGLVRSGAARKVVCARPELVWPVPAHWSLEDAATVPLAYAHALYCLVIRGNLLANASVLVHGGAGALGQAAIAIALAYNCEVFTTVSDKRKKHFLLKLFPGLKADHIGCSRDQSFKDLILTCTKGKGCNLVISSAPDDLKRDLIYCCSFQGTCLDLSLLHNKNDEFVYGMDSLFKQRAYAAIDFSSVFEPENIEDVKTLQRLLSEGIAAGYVRPLSRVTYEPNDAPRAFRLLAASQHRGRVLLRMQGHATLAEPRLICNPMSCHVILSDEETFSLALADRLVARGVKKLHIHCRGTSKAKLQFKMQTWQKKGVQTRIATENLNNENDVTKLLNDATNMGPVQGIYVVVNGDQTFEDTMFTNLDIASRRTCPNLRNFAIVNIGKTTFGRHVCLSRVQNSLPATMVTLADLSNKNFNREALEAAERALLSGEVTVVASRPRSKRPTLLQQITSLTGIYIPQNIPKTTIIKEFNIEEEKLNVVAALLRQKYDIQLTESQLSELKIETLLHIDDVEQDYEQVKGLVTFLTRVDSDEMRATTEFVFLPTLSSGPILRDDEFDMSQSHLCIIPGIEGHHERFRVLCERLKVPALVLQPGLDRPHETVQETAQRYAQILINKAGIKDTFYLLGYETGTLVALELAAILEDRGLTGTVYFLGCAPDEVKSVIEESISEFVTETDLQNAVIKHMYKLMVGDISADVERALLEADSWPHKVEACVKTLLGRVPHSAQYARALIEAALARVEGARHYEVRARPLRSQLVLLRANEVHATPASLLQRHSLRPVIVHQLEAPLAYAANDTSATSIINEFLDPIILKQFEEKSICDEYLLNTNHHG